MQIDTTLVDERLLSPLTRIFANEIGLSQTLVLLVARGGTQIRIPSVPEESTELSKIITIDSIARLTKKYAGKRFDLPKADGAIKQLRNQAIRAAFKTKTAPQLALEYGLSRKQIFNIVGNEQTNPTLPLF